MNERIKELWEEATVSMWPRPGKFTAGEYDYHLEKFAELIVREMCQVINADCELQMRQRVITNLGGLTQARELIKQHFGVGE
jgi:hypothetical protein